MNASNERVVVIADDDAAVRFMLKLALEAKGFTVHACVDGLEALDLFRSVKPGALLLDLDMPRLDGYQTARRIRAEEGAPQARLIAITGRTDEYASSRAWEAGFDEFLCKPVALSMLLGVLRPTREFPAIPEPN